MLSNIDAQGASVGSGYAQVLEAMAEETGAHLQKELGVAELRKIGIDLRAQPERGLLVFPGPSPTTASVSAVRDAVEAYYRNYTSASPTPVATASDLRTDGKALRQVTRPRYDSDSLYAVWCYARVAGKDRCDQPEIVWSRRTEVFFLAEPMDLLGLKPVSMRLPNLPKLMKDIPRMRKARALPFASMITPQDSGIKVGDDPKDTAREWGIAWICSFGIPIFTICAWILFKIIFSILIIIPGFAWMLLLKICIPVPAPVRKGA